MQPIAIVGPGAADLAAALVDRLDGRTAVVNRADGERDGLTAGDASDEATDGGVAVEPPADRTDADTEVTLAASGEWTGRGRVDGLDDLLDGFAPDHDYLVAVGDSRLRVPTVLLGGDADAEDTPGTVIAAADALEGIDLDRLVADLDAAEPWITRETLVRRVEASADADRAGAIATFTGRVRRQEDEDDPPTEFLEFEKYEGVAEERLAEIRADLEAREGVHEVRMHHRTGVVESGEDIVFVVVLAGHRREAFRTVEDGIDRLKDEVPLFKKEVTVEEEFWRHERPE